MLREEGREMSATRLGDKDESLNNVVVQGVLERGERGSIASMSLRRELIDVVIGNDGGVMGSDGEYCGKKERSSWISLYLDGHELTQIFSRPEEYDRSMDDDGG